MAEYSPYVQISADNTPANYQMQSRKMADSADPQTKK